MRQYSLTHLSDAILLRDLLALVTRDRLITATLLAHIAEVDARKLYRPAGYPSMHAYCVEELHLSEDAASRRIQAARAARRFPSLFTALAEGRLHLTGVCLLAPHLTPETAEELIEVATHKRKSEIEESLAGRYPLPEMPSNIRVVMPEVSELPQHAPAPVGSAGLAPNGILNEHAPAHVEGTQVQCPPQNSQRFLVQLTISKDTRDKLRHAQALLSHAVPNGDVAQVLDRALDALIMQLEKRKLGATTRRLRRECSTSVNRPNLGARYVPAQVRRALWERDKGRCTFVSENGTRCKARRFLEFDHVDPVARGGKATVDRMRLRCRAHNQYEAERTFGAGFMNRKRQEARLAAAEGRTRPTKEQSEDVLAGLRVLGCKANEARRAVTLSEPIPGATLEERMRAALKVLSHG